MTSVVDKNYQAKLEARRNGTTPVLVTLPEPGVGMSPEDRDARYRAKLAARLAPAAAPPTPPAEPVKPAVKVEHQPDAEPAKDSGDASKRGGKGRGDFDR